nr:hypothetical protein [Candidatus Sigynarchaeota archaeon]
MDSREILELAQRMASKEKLDDHDLLSIVSLFNSEMLGNVDGPDCTDRETCKNNCCGIMIDIPSVLAGQYIAKGYLRDKDIRRGDAFAWKLNVHPGTGRCVFYDPSIHGCKIYVDEIGLRPPQCAIYPAGYTTGAKACKAGAGPWTINDKRKGEACESLLKVYIAACVGERDKYREAFINDSSASLHPAFRDTLRDVKPSRIAG